MRGADCDSDEVCHDQVELEPGLLGDVGGLSKVDRGSIEDEHVQPPIADGLSPIGYGWFAVDQNQLAVLYAAR